MCKILKDTLFNGAMPFDPDFYDEERESFDPELEVECFCSYDFDENFFVRHEFLCIYAYAVNSS